MDKLFAYFGVTGLASVAAWALALVLLGAFARSRRRTRAYLIAFALSLLGFVLARVTSANISAIEIDRSAEEAALRAVQAGAAEGTGAREPAGAAAAPAEEPAYAYRKAGKQKREAEAAPAVAPEAAPMPEEADASAARRLPEADVLRADRYDCMNLFCARLVPWLALALLAYDYLSRFNRTRGYLPPIPLAGRLLDACFPKTHAVHLQVSDPAALRAHLADLVRKGETFIYLGESDPFAAVAELPRWSLGRLRLRPLAKLAVSEPGFPTSEFILDSAWFGRYFFVVTEGAAMRRLIADLVGYLRRRTGPRAAAGRTVNVVWHYPAPIHPATLEALVELCRETNFKLAVVGTGPPPKQFEAFFDECLEVPAQ